MSKVSMPPSLRDEVRSTLGALDPRDCRRLGTADVWIVEEPGLLADSRIQRAASIVHCKHQLLALFASGQVPAYLKHPDDPAEHDVHPTLKAAGMHTWHLPPGLPFDDPGLAYWLFTLGNWQAYVAAAAVAEGWVDPLRTHAEPLLAWMASHGVVAVIDSFHDDVEWLVAVL